MRFLRSTISCTFALYAINFEPINIKIRAPLNDRLNLSFVKDAYAIGKKMTRNGRKTAICHLQILGNSLYIPTNETSLSLGLGFGLSGQY